MELTKFNLKNKKILITGASSGIGRQIAIDISILGGIITITGRDELRLNETFTQLKGKNNKQIIADLTKIEDLQKLVDNCSEIDGVVYSAGITENLPISFIYEDYLNKIFDINFKSPVLLISKLLKLKKINSKSSIVFISSISSEYPRFGTAIYSSSKAALETFSKSLSLEIISKKIRSNCVSPSFVETQLFNNVKKSISNDTFIEIEKQLPLGVGKTQDVSNAVMFLLSDNSSWITGQNIKLGINF
jgi:NAD(P)-dependent dehydrogenase (short-subunit alcohol dehydrogenase family)